MLKIFNHFELGNFSKNAKIYCRSVGLLLLPESFCSVASIVVFLRISILLFYFYKTVLTTCDVASWCNKTDVIKMFYVYSSQSNTPETPKRFTAVDINSNIFPGPMSFTETISLQDEMELLLESTLRNVRTCWFYRLNNWFDNKYFLNEYIFTVKLNKK